MEFTRSIVRMILPCSSRSLATRLESNKKVLLELAILLFALSPVVVADEKSLVKDSSLL